MAQLQKTVEDTVHARDSIEAAVKKSGSTPSRDVVETVQRENPGIEGARIKAAMWDLVGSGRIEMTWDGKLRSSSTTEG